jgi:hypothetical protein
VFVGQTKFAFNGAVYPLRVAPLYQHLGGAIDFLTAHHLGWFALQHATVLVCGFAGILACYFSLCAMAPERRWEASAFATLYLSCPGLLGTIYTQDLYMTWMTVPFAPLAVYGIVRTFARDDITSQLWLAAPLAALWLAHSPIALWFSLIAFGTQCVRLLTVHRTAAAWKRAMLGAAAFVALGSYPFVSVATLKIPGTASAVTAGLAHQNRITNVIREVFPAVLFPLSDHARALSDLQLGYAFWLVVAGSLLVALWIKRLDLRLLLASCALLLALVLPVPGLTDWLWNHLPEQIKRITFYWPMHRFYLVLAALLATTGQLAVSAWAKRSRQMQFAVSIGLALACTWSLWESRQFIRAGADRTASAADSARRQRPENLLLMNHAYGLFTALPPRFSNGVVDPRSEVRLLTQDSLSPVPAPSSPNVLRGSFTGKLNANPGILDLSPSLHLAPGRRYELAFDWLSHDYQGVLQLVGRNLFREYLLPASGERLAFGAGAPHAASLTLWSTAPEGDTIEVRFIPTAPGTRPADFASFANFTLREIDRTTEFVEVTSLAPLKITTRAKSASWLETPRMALPGYRIDVDGHDSKMVRSSDGLLRVELPPGDHAITVTFPGPPILQLAYWSTLASWVMIACLLAAFSARRLRNLFAPAR